MFFIKGTTYARLWDLEEKKNKSNDNTKLVGRISTSETDQDGEKRYSNWFATFVGTAREDIKEISEGETFIINKCKITNESYKNKDGETRSYLSVTVFDVEPAKFNNSDKDEKKKTNKKEKPKNEAKSKTKSKSKVEEPDDDIDDGLPF